MAEISAALVKELRERTGAAMMDCKKALVEVGGDIEAAIEHMRKTGLAKAEKKARKAAQARKRGSRPSLTSRRADQGAEHVTSAGAQSATDAGVTDSSGRTAHPTTSDPVSSSIRRPRPARPGRPARHAGRALTAGSSDGYAPVVSGGSAADQAASTDAATIAATPQASVKATKAATVSSSASAKSAADAGPAIVDADAEAVAVA